jgi:hypothetical protein
MKNQSSAAVIILLWIGVATDVLAYQLTRAPIVSRQYDITPLSRNGRSRNTALFGLLGRFRKNRKVEQVETIKVGDKLPVGVDVERLLTTPAGSSTGEQLSEPIAIQEVLGQNKALLIGWYFARLSHVLLHLSSLSFTYTLLY